MNCRQPIATNDAIEFAKGFLHCNVRAEIVTGGKNVSGIEANAEPFGLPHLVKDLRDLFEAMAEARALASRGFERDFCFQLWNHPPDRIDRPGDFLEPGFFAGTEMCAGMHHEKWQLEVIGPNQLLC